MFKDKTRKKRYESGLRIRKFSIYFSVLTIFILLTLYVFRQILFPFVIALIIVYVLYPAVKFFVSKGVPRALSVVITYTLFLFFIFLFFVYTLPKAEREGIKIYNKFKTSFEDIPGLLKSIDSTIDSLISHLPFARGEEKGGADEEEVFKSDFSFSFIRVPKIVEGVRPEVVSSIAGGENYNRLKHITIKRLNDGSYSIILPSNGISIKKVDDYTYKIVDSRDELTEISNQKDSIKRALLKNIQKGLTDFGNFIVSNILQAVRFIIQSAWSLLLAILIVFMVSVFTLFDVENIFNFIYSKVPPDFAKNMKELFKLIDEGFSGVVRGQLFICVVNGILSGIGFSIFIPEYALILAIIAGVFSLIPIFGSILSSIPAILVGLTISFKTALFVLLWILGIHFIEANILNPKIIGSQAKIHPVIVVFVLIAGEKMFGIPGALLAVPVTSFFKALFVFTYRKIKDF